jgi:hypothetical protein
MKKSHSNMVKTGGAVVAGGGLLYGIWELLDWLKWRKYKVAHVNSPLAFHAWKVAGKPAA